MRGPIDPTVFLRTDGTLAHRRIREILAQAFARVAGPDTLIINLLKLLLGIPTRFRNRLELARLHLGFRRAAPKRDRDKGTQRLQQMLGHSVSFQPASTNGAAELRSYFTACNREGQSIG